MSKALTLGLDYTSGGTNWRDHCGRSGYQYINLSGVLVSSLPGWISSVEYKTLIGNTPRYGSQTYAADASRLQYHDKSNFTNGCWVGNTFSGGDEGGFLVTFNCVDDTPTVLSLYTVDPDSIFRRYKFGLWTTDRSTLLSSEVGSTRIHRPGLWYRALFSGSCTLVLTKLVGANSQINGMMFDRYVGGGLGLADRPGHYIL